MHAPIETDALVIGAGPVGLFQAFQLGLQGISCHIVDALPYVGGQCVELYGDKPIYDIPGIPRCTGRELIARLQEQVQPFAPTLHLSQRVATLTVRDDGRFDLTTSAGTAFVARSVFIAGGVGAFEPRRLTLDGARAYEEGGTLHYRLDDTTAFAGQNVWLNGGDEAAVRAALVLTEATPGPTRVTLMHRRDVFTAPPELLDAMRAAMAAGRLQLQIGQLAALQGQAGRLDALDLVTPAGDTVRHPVQQLIALLGVSPKLGPIADWGLAMERKQLVVDAEHFATSIPGIYAVGDINTYPGKKKLILCGFHEATLAAFSAAATLRPERKVPLQYTTTSTELHRLLGVRS